MKATTLKIENPLLSQLNNIKPKKTSLSAFVRNILEKEVLRKKMTEAADEYAHFLTDNSDEAQWLEEWESANLASSPKQIKKGKNL